jgi:glutamine cyclotransferase
MSKDNKKFVVKRTFEKENSRKINASIGEKKRKFSDVTQVDLTENKEENEDIQTDQIGFHHIGTSFYRVTWPKHVSFGKGKNVNLILIH